MSTEALDRTTSEQAYISEQDRLHHSSNIQNAIDILKSMMQGNPEIFPTDDSIRILLIILEHFDTELREIESSTQKNGKDYRQLSELADLISQCLTQVEIIGRTYFIKTLIEQDNNNLAERYKKKINTIKILMGTLHGKRKIEELRKKLAEILA